MNRKILITLLAAGALAGCDDTPVSPAVESSVLSLIGGLEPGESFTLSGADAAQVFLAGGEAGAEYLLVPFNGATSTDELAVEIAGDDVSADPPQQARVATDVIVPPEVLRRAAADRAHLRFRARSLEQTRRLLRAPAPRDPDRTALVRRGDAAPLAVPQVGELLELNAQFNDPCANPDTRSGRVVDVGEHAIIVADTANPAGGFTDADYAEIADEFDQLIHPVVTGTFGEPTDLDGNSRAIIFFTSAVNDLTPFNSEGIIVGLFHPRDLFPRVDDERFVGCPTSNAGEIFYLVVPDPVRAQQEPAFDKEFVARVAMSTIGHEYQHLINSALRLYVNNAEDWEEVWLDEGLSHIAEELLFYEAAGVEPGGNLDLDIIRSSTQVLDAANRYVLANFNRYAFFLERPDRSSLFEADLGARGAIWSFLRYVADHAVDDDRAFFHTLANSGSSGIDNLNAALGDDVLALAHDWAAAVYLDDAVTSVPERYTQPSWDFRSLLSAFYDEFPLVTRPLGPGAGETLSLKGGGAAFVRLGVDASTRASLATTSGGSTPPPGLSLTVVRTR